MENRRLGLLGGTFDPVHNGHMDLARVALETLALDGLLFIPAPSPPHKEGRPITSFAHRLRMVELAIAGCDRLSVSDLEARRAGKSYTYDTLCALRAAYPEYALYFLTGADALQAFTSWHRWQDILDLCTVVVTTRPGFPFVLPEELANEAKKRRGGFLLLDKEAVAISATELRRAIGAGGDWQRLVPPAVARYIEENHLYRG